jgi:hypothetical protein
MFPTLVILNAPKSGTPDFGVKPGNDGGNRRTSVLHPFDRDLLLERDDDWKETSSRSSLRIKRAGHDRGQPAEPIKKLLDQRQTHRQP